MAELNSVAQEPLKSRFNEAIAVNSTAFEDKNTDTSELESVGYMTETPLLRFAQNPKWAPYQQTRSGADITQMILFSSERQATCVITKFPNGKWRLDLKGASKILARMYKRHVVVQRAGQLPDAKEVETAPIININDHMQDMAGAAGKVPYETIAEYLTLISIVGIEGPLCPGVK
ncbi:calcium-transporting ATPase [Ceratobasidium sp. AG-Ba]|nr:calcium-transporting ATPase [Ceratobasidium sp. AG-Ba]QRW06482.1 calcium-transporting ATPase [Ceratobasidium sp. AG-Ba]